MGQVRARSDEVLAVVEHQQCLSAAQPLGDRFEGKTTGPFADVRGRSYSGRHTAWIGYRRELGQPHPIRKSVEEVCRDVQRQPGLAATACAGEGEQPRRLEAPNRACKLTLSSDQRGRLRRKIVGTRIQASERGKTVGQAFD